VLGYDRGHAAVRNMTAVIGVLAASLHSQPLSAADQMEVQVPDHISCPRCTIDAGGASITLVPPADQFSFTSFPPLSVARDSDGNYIVGPVTGEAVLAVFGPEGAFRSSFGRTGSGPEEFLGPPLPLFIGVGDGDVVYVVDPAAVHVLAPQAEHHLARSRLSVRSNDAVVLGDRLVVQATVRTSEGYTFVQLLRPDGSVDRSIGVDSRPTGSAVPWDNAKVLARSASGGVWSADASSYVISEHGLDGKEMNRFHRVSRWFRSSADGANGAPFYAAASMRVSDLVQDARGLLWVAITHAPRTFAPLSPSGGREGRLDPYLDMSRFLHTSIEVLDPVAGEVVARRDLEEYVRFVRTAGNDVLVYSVRPGSSGDLVCTVTPLRLRRQ